jgi:hypothetical protein
MTTGSLAVRIKSVHAWREVAALLFIPADIVWLTGWYCLLTGIVDTHEMMRSLGIFVFSSLLAYLMLRSIYSWQVPGILRLLLGALGLLIGIWLGENLLIYQRPVLDPHRVLIDIWSSFSGLRSLSVEFWTLIGLSLLGLRSIQHARKPVTQDTVLGSIQFDLVMMLGILFLPGRPELNVILVGFSIFLVLALSSLSLTRIADINFYRGGRRFPFRPDWLAALVGISIGLVTFSGIFAYYSSAWLVVVIISLTNGLIEALRLIIEKLLLPIVTFISPVFQKLIDFFFKPEDTFKMLGKNLEPGKLIADLDPNEIEQISSEVLRTAQPYVISILLGMVIFGVILAVLKKSWKERLNEIDDSSREQVEGSFLKMLQNSINLRIQAAFGSVIGKGHLKRTAGLFRAARIRWIYHQLEGHSARKGVPRPAAVTPLEYRARLVTVFPGGEEDLTLLTRAYLSVRYGELPETAQKVIQVEDAWERLRTLKPTRDAGRIIRRRKP